MFLEFINKKETSKYNAELIQVMEGYGDLLQIGTKDNDQLFKIVINPNAKRAICFIGGIHGDEKGGPYGILEFLKEKPYIIKTKKVIIIPVANPTGFNVNKRKNADEFDINRHFFNEELKDECKFIWDALKDENIELLHTLHEDPDSKSFYLYYTHHNELAKDLRELAEKYFDIYPKSKPPIDAYTETSVYGDKIYNGLIPLPHTNRGGVEDKLFKDKLVPYITTESPGKIDLKKRTEFNKKAIKLAINSF